MCWYVHNITIGVSVILMVAAAAFCFGRSREDFKSPFCVLPRVRSRGCTSIRSSPHAVSAVFLTFRFVMHSFYKRRLRSGRLGSGDRHQPGPGGESRKMETLGQVSYFSAGFS